MSNIIFKRWEKRLQQSDIPSVEKKYLLTLEEESLATYLYEEYYVRQHLSQIKIGEMLHCSNTVIFELFGKYEFVIRKPIYGVNFKHKSLYTCNESYFDKISDEGKAYWLGFMYADGYVGIKRKYRSATVGITLAEKDNEHLEKFLNSISATHQIKYYKVTGDKSFSTNSIYCRIIIHSQHMHDELIIKGCFESKTDKIDFPSENIVPIDLLRHFIRGYFDGDGSIIVDKNGTYRYAFCGTEKFLEKLMNNLYENNIIKRKYKLNTRRKGQLVKELKVGGRNQVFLFLNYIYKDSNIYLDRKYNIYQKILQEKILYDYEHRHKCDVCGTTASSDFITCKISGEFLGKRLCLRHYKQVKNNRPITIEKTKKCSNICDICGDVQSKKFHVYPKPGDYFNKCLCSKHYYQITTYGKTIDNNKESMKQPLNHVCSICGCTDSRSYYHWHEPGSIYDGQELCNAHYQQLRRNGKITKIRSSKE